MIIRNSGFSIWKDSFEHYKPGGIHPYHEILYIHSGQAQLDWMGKEYTGGKGCLFLIHANTPHRLYSPTSPLEFWYMELDMKANERFPNLRNCIRWNQMQSEVILDALSKDPLLQWTLDSIGHIMKYRNIKSSFTSRESVLLDIQKLIILIESTLQKEDAQMKSNVEKIPEIVIDVMRYIESHHNRDITLKEISDYVNLNPSYLVRLFKKHTRMTPFEYLSNLRLEAASCFLSSTNMSVQEIAFASGYQSLWYFSKTFKKRYGVSPSHWRNEIRK